MPRTQPNPVHPQPQNPTLSTTMTTTSNLVVQDPAPFADFADLDRETLDAIIDSVKSTMGRELLILGHHYQRDEVVRHAHLTGDSLKLSQLAARDQNCHAIAFCGVHFMAETADILSQPHVSVHLPDLAAGCSMADMADLDAVLTAWDELANIIDTTQIVPVTYINSTADLKAFCGRHGGIVCTSSNAHAILQWAFSRGQYVLFFPDQHLGRNTARSLGITPQHMILWDPRQPLGGNQPHQIQQSQVLLWKGHCSVHQMFKPSHVKQFRSLYPTGRVLVHPECMMEVVDASDLVGSTQFIIDTIATAPAGSIWGVGTELHLVNRLAHEHPEQSIHFLSSMICMCATMYRIDLPHLAWCLANLERGTPVNQVSVPQETAHWARVALDRMLALR